MRRCAWPDANLMVSDMLTFRAQWAIAEKPNFAYGPMAKMFSSEKFQSDARSAGPHGALVAGGPRGPARAQYGLSPFPGHRSMAAPAKCIAA
jgi:hypothetical protein